MPEPESSGVPDTASAPAGGSEGLTQQPVVTALQLESFRCFESVSIEPVAGFNVIAGGNGSGKTSLLEALYFLGRGVSFRVSRPDAAVRHGEGRSTAFARLGVGLNTRAGLEIARGDGVSIRVDGEPGTRADLVRALPVQLLDPGSHELVAGPPAGRRQFLDWGVFHVEQHFLPAWQRYRRGLQQRNAALRVGSARDAWLWDGTLIAESEVIDTSRRHVIASLQPLIGSMARQLLDAELTIDYLPGWADGELLAIALERNRDRDLQMRSTTVGPHRADLRISLHARRARESVSRGQEKLVVASLVLAQLQLVSKSRRQPVVLLLDEPGADLDRDHLQKLLGQVAAAPAQAFVTSLDAAALRLPAAARVFHVEHSKVQVLL